MQHVIQEIVGRQLDRAMRLEGAQVTGLSGDGTLDLRVGTRPRARTKVAPGRSTNAARGDRFIVLAAGENDKPVALCPNPWLM